LWADDRALEAARTRIGLRRFFGRRRFHIELVVLAAALELAIEDHDGCDLACVAELDCGVEVDRVQGSDFGRW
jgi:hypothetical protein